MQKDVKENFYIAQEEELWNKQEFVKVSLISIIYVKPLVKNRINRAAYLRVPYFFAAYLIIKFAVRADAPGVPILLNNPL